MQILSKAGAKSTFITTMSSSALLHHLMRGIIVLTLGWCQLHSAEEQVHGVIFEQWIRDTFFNGYKPKSYTQKWDIPAAANRRFGGVPVNPKAAKYGTPVDLGDALRQFDIAEPFILALGFWQQAGEEKRFVNLVAPRIEPAAWRKLWGVAYPGPIDSKPRQLKGAPR